MISIQTALTHARAALAIISQTSRLDAEVLLAHVLNHERSHLYAHPETALTEAQNEQYQTLIQRRAAGEPVAYIVGVKEFWSLPLRVSPDVLIPRPETELLVELALARIPKPGVFEIADLGTGSGAIALAIASERSNCKIIATDVSRQAVGVAVDNAHRLGLTNIRFVASDWFRALRERFHLIVSNPPYVAAEDPHLLDSALQFEPDHALISGADGLDDIELIARQAPAFLHPGGWLILEHGHDQGAAVRKSLDASGFREVTSHQDPVGHERATSGQRRSA